MKLIKSVVGVFNIDTQKHLENVDIKKVDSCMERYRKAGYSVCVDIDGDLCVDRSDDDNGEDYETQLKR